MKSEILLFFAIIGIRMDSFSLPSLKHKAVFFPPVFLKEFLAPHISDLVDNSLNVPNYKYLL